MNERLYFIDLAKGIGIILVIIGHGMFPFHFAIDIFHMPLFFVLTGYTITKSIEKYDFLSFFIKKTNRIFIPYVFFMLVSSVITYFSSIIFDITLYNGPLWFLQTLFISTLIYYIFYKNTSTNNRHVLVFLLSIAVYIIVKYSNIDVYLPFSILRALESVILIHFGAILRGLGLHHLSNKKMIFLLAICFVTYLIGLYISKNFYDLSGLDYYKAGVYTYNYFLFYFTSLSGLLSVLSFCIIMKQNCKTIVWLGRNSLLIMCVHYPILELTNHFICSNCNMDNVISQIVAGISSFVITIILSTIIAIVLQKYIPQFIGSKDCFNLNYNLSE